MLRIDFKSSTYDDNPYSSFCNRYHFDVFLCDEGELNEGIFIGKGMVILYLVEYAIGNMKTENDEYTYMDDVFDGNHHKDIYNILFEASNGNQIKEEWIEAMIDSVGCYNILVPDRLEILPQYRNKGYGKEITRMIRRYFCGCYGIEIIKAFPLQLENFKNDGWRASMDYPSMEQDEKKAKSSLYNMYKKKGYKRYKRTEYFYYIP